MGPISTGLGEVFHYIVTTDDGDLTRAKTLHDWEVKPAMRTAVAGTRRNQFVGPGL